MSRFLSRADEIAAIIKALPFVSGPEIPVVVKKGVSLDSVLTEKFGKKSKGVIVIDWLGGANPYRDSAASPRFGASYAVSIWLPRTYPPGVIPVDDFAEKIAEALQCWVSPDAGALMHPLEVTSIKPLPDDDLNAAVVYAEFFRV